MSFAKDTFLKHKEDNVIGVSAPILEASTNKFFSFSDSFLPYPNDNKIVQTSYTYGGINNDLINLKNIIQPNSNIKDVKAYLYLLEDKFTADFFFKTYKNNKPTLKELEDRINKGKELSILSNGKHIVQDITMNQNIFKEVYLVEQSAIFDDSKIIYSILFDQTNYNNTLDIYNLSIIIFIIIFILALVISYKIMIKENKLSFQDKFVQQSLHEIKTPLSIISLNNELRELKLGDDPYSTKINNAIKTLNQAYNDMNFIANSEQNINYPNRKIDLSHFLQERVNHFKSSFTVQKKDIKLIIKGNYHLKISDIELERVIDNNLSNCLKYSKDKTTTIIKLNNNILEFETNSEKIDNIEKLFDKYYRENSVKGGYGLGLNIVKNILQKYNLSYTVSSNYEKTIFKYIL